MPKVSETIFKDFSLREMRRVLKWMRDDYPASEYQTDRSHDLGKGSSHIDPKVQQEYDERINSGQFHTLIDYMEDLGLLNCVYRGKGSHDEGYWTRHRITAQGMHFLRLRYLPIQWCYLYSDTVKTAAAVISISSIIMLLILD